MARPKKGDNKIGFGVRIATYKRFKALAQKKGIPTTGLARDLIAAFVSGRVKTSTQGKAVPTYVNASFSISEKENEIMGEIAGILGVTTNRLLSDIIEHFVSMTSTEILDGKAAFDATLVPEKLDRTGKPSGEPRRHIGVGMGEHISTLDLRGAKEDPQVLARMAAAEEADENWIKAQEEE